MAKSDLKFSVKVEVWNYQTTKGGDFYNYYDISNRTENATWITSMEDVAGKLTLSIQDPNDEIIIDMGDDVKLWYDNKPIFYGRVFELTINEGTTKNIVIYDNLYYLKNKDAATFSGSTITGIFSIICATLGLKFKVDYKSNFILPEMVFDNKSYGDMMKEALEAHLAYTGEWWVLYCDVDTIRLMPINYLYDETHIDGESIMTGFTFKEDISGDTANQVKLIREDSDAGKRQIYIQRDNASIKKWGFLQYYEKIDDNATDAQMKQRLAQVFLTRNMPARSLSLNAIGVIGVRAGRVPSINIPKIRRYLNVTSETGWFAIVKECTHTLSNSEHTMKLDIWVIGAR